MIDTDEGANTVIVDRDYDVFNLQNAYYTHSQQQFHRIRVEDISFVRACIKKRTFKHTPVVRYPMRGNHAGSVTMTFPHSQVWFVDDFLGVSITPKRMKRSCADISQSRYRIVGAVVAWGTESTKTWSIS